MTSRKRRAQEPPSPPRSYKQPRLSPQGQKADLSRQPNGKETKLAMRFWFLKMFNSPRPPLSTDDETSSSEEEDDEERQKKVEKDEELEVIDSLAGSMSPEERRKKVEKDEELEVVNSLTGSMLPEERREKVEKDEELEVVNSLTGPMSPEEPRMKSHGIVRSTSGKNDFTLDEISPVLFHGPRGDSQSTPKHHQRQPSSSITTTYTIRPSFSVDRLAENIDNIRLDSSHSSLQSSQITTSSFSRGSTVQSRATYSIFRKPRFRPRRKPHINERKFKASVRERNREALKEQLDQIRKHHRELVNGRSVKGAMNFADFRLLLHGLDVGPLVADSRLIRDRFPNMSRLYVESGNRIKRSIDSAKATLNSPKPTVFTPTENQRKLVERIKDAAIEARLRGFPDNLPPKEEEEVDAILRKRGVVAKFAREQVSDVDIARLSPGQWLNDEIINFYGAMILSRSEANKENAQVSSNGDGNGPLDIHYFSTFFWAKLCKEGYERGRLAKWTKKLDIFSKDVILIPINHSNAHWTAAAINFRKKRIESYDSMRVTNCMVPIYLRKYLDAEHRDKKKKPFDFTGWEDFAPNNTPEQANGWDCGVFTCHFLEAISRGEQEFAFSQSHMPYLRRRMIWEIGKATLRRADYK